jgi:RNA:NAD 2'-phosphotransferase (TPT1/KptA family)
MTTLYHGTSTVHLDSIKRLGLVPGLGEGNDAWAISRGKMVGVRSRMIRPPSVYLSKDVSTAMSAALNTSEEVGGYPVIIKVDVPEDVFATFTPDELWDDDTEAWRTDKVAAEYVSVVKDPVPLLVSEINEHKGVRL